MVQFVSSVIASSLLVSQASAVGLKLVNFNVDNNSGDTVLPSCNPKLTGYYNADLFDKLTDPQGKDTPTDNVHHTHPAMTNVCNALVSQAECQTVKYCAWENTKDQKYNTQYYHQLIREMNFPQLSENQIQAIQVTSAFFPTTETVDDKLANDGAIKWPIAMGNHEFLTPISRVATFPGNRRAFFTARATSTTFIDPEPYRVYGFGVIDAHITGKPTQETISTSFIFGDVVATHVPMQAKVALKMMTETRTSVFLEQTEDEKQRSDIHLTKLSDPNPKNQDTLHVKAIYYVCLEADVNLMANFENQKVKSVEIESWEISKYQACPDDRTWFEKVERFEVDVKEGLKREESVVDGQAVSSLGFQEDIAPAIEEMIPTYVVNKINANKDSITDYFKFVALDCAHQMNDSMYDLLKWDLKKLKKFLNFKL